MRRHRFDAASFTFGALFLCAAVFLWVAEGLEITATAASWVAAGVLLVLGTTLLVSSRRRSDDDPTS